MCAVLNIINPPVIFPFLQKLNKINCVIAIRSIFQHRLLHLFLHVHEEALLYSYLPNCHCSMNSSPCDRNRDLLLRNMFLFPMGINSCLPAPKNTFWWVTVQKKQHRCFLVRSPFGAGEERALYSLLVAILSSLKVRHAD